MATASLRFTAALAAATLIVIGAANRSATSAATATQSTQQMTKLTSHLKLGLDDKKADAEVAIASLVASFATNDDDKDREDGISESYRRGTEILGKNDSWGRGLVFRDHSINSGQTFDIASHGIKAKDIGAIKYVWSMDNNDGWNVGMTIYATLSNGHVYIVGAHYWNIHGGANSGSIPLSW